MSPRVATPRPRFAPDRLYQALVERDAAFEGVFVVGVRTTGIFCRPTCRARKPKRENVEFFASCALAAAAGYRACKVCMPTRAPLDAAPRFYADLTARLRASPFERITDGTLRSLGYEPRTVQRWFKKQYSVTFHAWQRMVRLNSAFQRLAVGQDVTTAAMDSGYASLSGFGEAFKHVFGFAPSKKGAKAIAVARRIETPLGPMMACALDHGLCLLEFLDRRMLQRELVAVCRTWNARIVHGDHRHLDQIARELGEYFAGRRSAFDVPCVVHGTPLQRRVWKQLQAVPYGSTESYQEQARAIGAVSSVRAVASANGTNRLALVIPCHRVIGKDGTLKGYGGGVWRKKWLLDLEAKHRDAAAIRRS